MSGKVVRLRGHRDLPSGLDPASGMNLVTDMPRLNGLQASTMGWLLSSEIRLSAGFASSRKLLLYGMYRTILNPRRVAFMVTTAAEAIEGL